MKKGLALFFTRGISLRKWDEVGNLSREIKPYNLLARDFKRIYFFTYGGKEDLKYKKLLAANIRIIPKRLPLPSTLYSFLLPFVCRRELKEVDILKTNQMDGSWAAVIAKLLYRKKLVVRCGYELYEFAQKLAFSWWKQKLIFWAERLAYRYADAIFLATKRDKEFVQRTFSIEPAKIKVVPNYIDIQLFKPLPVKKERGRVIFVGRLEKQKNLFNLFRALKGLPLRLVVIGKGSLKPALRRLAKKLELSVEFKGTVPQERLPLELNKSEIFVLPSYFEGCPKALLEAMSCGLAVIGAKVEGIKEIIKSQENGLLCQTDWRSIRQALKRLSADTDLRQRLGKQARETILKEFSLEKIVAKERSIYASL